MKEKKTFLTSFQALNQVKDATESAVVCLVWQVQQRMRILRRFRFRNPHRKNVLFCHRRWTAFPRSSQNQLPRSSRQPYPDRHRLPVWKKTRKVFHRLQLEKRKRKQLEIEDRFLRLKKSVKMKLPLKCYRQVYSKMLSSGKTLRRLFRPLTPLTWLS